ncbi:MAG: YkgJ family cysteine cluster protein [Candidatus Nezhaarchaeota archaeon]|nr:YkgJ family cysteine cluster protein [Candidatus Nezhaarchaeota archaeon]MCX8141188.1 YkgJ family cysteine cluster protein [Candidatus Nezhaarchaeota archaeon]MDW8049454.1 YkgJ family cysteine cluster protein [Nitrososphaerota archaeon]
MKCAKCGKCCSRNEILLSTEDISKIVSLGYDKKEFAIKSGPYIKLRMVDGYCFFFDPYDKTCEIYPYRPTSCRLYPVIYVLGKGPLVDSNCPMAYTVSRAELTRKGKLLEQHLSKVFKRARRIYLASLQK